MSFRKWVRTLSAGLCVVIALSALTGCGGNGQGADKKSSGTQAATQATAQPSKPKEKAKIQYYTWNIGAKAILEKNRFLGGCSITAGGVLSIRI